MAVSPEVIERLVSDPEQPIDAIMLEVYEVGVDALLGQKAQACGKAR
jgi:hypothetical protein